MHGNYTVRVAQLFVTSLKLFVLASVVGRALKCHAVDSSSVVARAANGATKHLLLSNSLGPGRIWFIFRFEAKAKVMHIRELCFFVSSVPNNNIIVVVIVVRVHIALLMQVWCLG